LSFLFLLVMIIDLVISVALIWVVQMKMSKHGGLGGAFGSGSLYTVFGREKGLDTLAKVTIVLAVAFMVMSVITAYVLTLR